MNSFHFLSFSPSSQCDFLEITFAPESTNSSPKIGSCVSHVYKSVESSPKHTS
ncbi:hypothetical protein GHT09_013429 [Marmota monax]|uniref:Uncharacterized protein n=1 Tax=Marmota monax TaxID=9995 RepID=A0A834UZ81_MARMO|nr:hypothetical protein GHT09_013429 [Marmota monax]